MYFHGTSTWGPHQYDKGRYSGKVSNTPIQPSPTSAGLSAAHRTSGCQQLRESLAMGEGKWSKSHFIIPGKVSVMG
jgi:hypothetical protein